MPDNSRPFSLLIKPASADCNLDCPYCFYRKRAVNYPEPAVHRMTMEVLEILIKKYMATEQPQYIFAWQGGEPTLMGIDFFNHAIKLQIKYARPGSVIANALQTNATLISDDWAHFLADNKFLVGLSIDGPQDLHNHYRKYGNGKGSHQKVIKAVNALQKNHIQFNALTLVTDINAHRGKEVYNYLKDYGVFYQQYIECIEFDRHGRPLPFSITGAQWGTFLCEIFDEWIKNDTRFISVRLFDSILSHLVDNGVSECRFGKNCCHYFVVEFNGDLYPCDFFVEPQLKLGNIVSDTWLQIDLSNSYQQFGERKSQWTDECIACEFLSLCLGDCPKNRGKSDPFSLKRKSLLCEGWKLFYQHALPQLNRLAAEIRQERKLIASDSPVI